MPQTTTPNPGTAAKKPRRPHLHIMVVQRLSKGVAPGPIHVFKKVLNETAVGSMVKQVRVPVPLDHTLPAGTGALTAADKRAFADQGLSGPEIAYVEGKLPEKKLKSDAHEAAFEAGKELRLKQRLEKRLVAQLLADPDLAASIVAALNGTPANGEVSTEPMPAPSQKVLTLGEKVSRLLALIDEVGRDIETYKERAKVGKTYDKDKLRLMLTKEAERDWKLAWFAFSRMVGKATGTPFARSKEWRNDADNSRLAAAHGYESARAVK
jgi:hypothetical protein